MENPNIVRHVYL